MDGFLKQTTAATVKIGPFLDATDGNSSEGGLTIGYAAIRLSKNGGNLAAKSSEVTCTHDELGWYDCPLATTDTNTLGRLQLMAHVAGALPVWHAFEVLPANVFDSLVGGSDYLQADAVQIAGAGVSASLGQVGVNVVNWKGAAAPAMTGDAYARVGAPAGASLAADVAALKAETAKILSDTSTDGVAVAAAAVASIQSGLALSANLSTVGTAVASILVDTSTDGVKVLAADIATIRADLALAANLTTVGAVVDSIKVDTSALAARCTEARLAELDAANLPADVDTIKISLSALADVCDLIKLDTSAIPGLTSALGALDTSALNALTDVLGELDASAIAALGGGITGLEEDLSALAAKVDVVDAVVDSIKIDTSAVAAWDFAGLAADLSTAAGVVDSIKIDTSAVAAWDFAGLAADVSALPTVAGIKAGLETTDSLLELVYARLFEKVTLTRGSSPRIRLYAADGVTVRKTQVVSDDGTTETQGAAT
jgi:hypothetical protein